MKPVPPFSDAELIMESFSIDQSKKINASEKTNHEKVLSEFKKLLTELDNTPNTIDIFEKGDFVSVSGLSKGKGFAGHMKRHGFSGGRASHGKNSVMRKAGSVGAGTSPGKIWKGSRMAGRMGRFYHLQFAKVLSLWSWGRVNYKQ